jgi:hypothetical protein
MRIIDFVNPLLGLCMKLIANLKTKAGISLQSFAGASERKSR